MDRLNGIELGIFLEIWNIYGGVIPKNAIKICFHDS